MHTWAVFATLAVAAAAVQSNPHIKAKQAKPLPVLNTRSVEVEDSRSYRYLTNKTESMFPTLQSSDHI